MNLLMNDESGYIKVVDFPRGSQARKVASSVNFDPELFEGAIIVAVNGTRYTDEDGEEIFGALKNPSRPTTIRFKFADHKDVIDMKDFISKSKGEESDHDLSNCDTHHKNSQNDSVVEAIEFMKVEIEDSGPLGIVFSKSLDNFALIVQDIKTGSDNLSFNLGQKKIALSKGLLLSHVNDQMIIGHGAGMKKAFSVLESACLERPLSLTFIDPYHNLIRLKQSECFSEKGGPEEFVLEVQKLHGAHAIISIRGFRNVDGMAETGGAVIGDKLLFINGEPVGAACNARKLNSPNFEQVMCFLKNPKSYPLALTFGRESQGTSRWAYDSSFDLDQAFTFCVTIDSFDELGCTLEVGSDAEDFIVKEFHGINGPFQRQILSDMKYHKCVGLAIESINGEVIPSYATCDIVMNAMKRQWAVDKNIELLLCNIKKKNLIEQLVNS